MHELDGEHRHLVLLCENNVGYRNLTELVSRAWTEGFYSKPRVDMELLEQYHEGLIALSACLAGEIPRALTANDYEGAREAALRYESIFGKGNFFLELQDHGIREQKLINPQLIRLSRELDIPLVVTNDCHYITREDHEMHHVLLCIQTNRTIEEKDGLEFGSQEFYFKSEEEMRVLFPDLPEAADNTWKNSRTLSGGVRIRENQAAQILKHRREKGIWRISAGCAVRGFAGVMAIIRLRRLWNVLPMNNPSLSRWDMSTTI